MASRADLESCESDCKSVDDFVALAQQALADPIDKEYAKALLEKAEMQCQMPLDYIKTADVVAAELGDQAYAKDLYEQAEDMLFELSEFTAFARGMARHMGDKDKAREYLEKAADEASQPNDFLNIAKIAREDLKDEELSSSLLSKLARAVSTDLGDSDWSVALIDKATEIGDDHFVFAQMGLITAQNGNSEKAEFLYQKAIEACENPTQMQQLVQRLKSDRVDFALIRKLYSSAKSQLDNATQRLRWVEGIMPLFKDRDWATQQYDELSSTFSTGKKAARLRASRQSRLRTGLY